MWYYVNYVAPFNGVLDVARTNENFLGTAGLLASGLGEHCWASDFVSTPAMIETDIGLRHIERLRTVNPIPANVLDAEPSTTWQDVDPDGTFFQRSFRTKGGKFYVEVSFAFSCGILNASIDPGLNFAIAIDGVVQNDTVIGSGDIGGDDIRASGNLASPRTGGTPFTGSNGYGPAVRMLTGGLTLTWIGYIPPGVHKVGLVYRNPMPCNQPGTQGVLGGELNVLEMWA